MRTISRMLAVSVAASAIAIGLGLAAQAGQTAQAAPELRLLRLGIGLEVGDELLRRGAPAEPLGVGSHRPPVELQAGGEKRRYGKARSCQKNCQRSPALRL